MKRKATESLTRACEVIKNDRLGVSQQIEGTISKEVAQTLSQFFSLYGSVSTVIVPQDGGFEIKIKACAKSVKQFRIIG